jgi:bacteriorhodopsin
MDWQATFHWVYVIAMASGALYFMALSRNPRGVPKEEYLVATFIPIWSGLAYLAMAMGQGKVEIAGQMTHYARYMDWFLTTPLLLLSLAWTAMHQTAKDWMLIAALMGTQVIVIGSGLIADLSTTDETRFVWYTPAVSLRFS